MRTFYVRTSEQFLVNGSIFIASVVGFVFIKLCYNVNNPFLGALGYVVLTTLSLLLLSRVLATSHLKIDIARDHLHIVQQHAFRPSQEIRIPLSSIIIVHAYNKQLSKYYRIPLKGGGVFFVQQYKWMMSRRDDFEEVGVAITNAVEQYRVNHAFEFSDPASNAQTKELVNKELKRSKAMGWFNLSCYLGAYILVSLSILTIVLPNRELSFYLKLVYAGIAVIIMLISFFAKLFDKKKCKRKKSGF